MAKEFIMDIIQEGIIIRYPLFKNMKIQKVFKKEQNILIGMIHLPTLLPVYSSKKLKWIIEQALADLKNLEKAGFDAVLIENDNDKPHTELATPIQIANFTQIAKQVCAQAKIPVGVQIMLNDWKASFLVAKAVGAKFTRLDVFVDHVTCDWCEINPNPKEIIKFKNKVYPKLLLLTDVQVKYKKMVKKRSIIESASLAIKNKTDGLVITGIATGAETPIRKLQNVRVNFVGFPIFVGAGINEKNILKQLSIANGAIVGSSIKTKGRIDFIKAQKLVSKIFS